MDDSNHEERMEGAGDFWARVGQGLGCKKFEAEADGAEDKEITAMLEAMARHREEMAKKREEAEAQPGTLAEAMRKLEEDYINGNGKK